MIKREASPFLWALDAPLALHEVLIRSLSLIDHSPCIQAKTDAKKRLPLRHSRFSEGEKQEFMTLSKKGRRTIVLEQRRYYWATFGGDEGILLVVEPEPEPEPRHALCVQVAYEGNMTEQGYTQTAITPSLVRKAIEHAHTQGWETPLCEVVGFGYQKGIFTTCRFIRKLAASRKR